MIDLKQRQRDGIQLLENLGDLVLEDIRIGQAIAICLKEGDDLFTIENNVLLKRIREVRGLDNETV